MLSDVGQLRNAHHPCRIRPRTTADARNEAVAAVKASQLDPGAGRDAGVLGARHDRGEGPVDVEENRSARGVGGEAADEVRDLHASLG